MSQINPTKIKRIALKTTLTLLPLGFITFNVLAYVQVYAMLNFSKTGERTAQPEALSFWQKIQTLAMGINIPKPQNSATPAEKGLKYEIHQIQVASDITLEAWYIPHTKAEGMVLMFHGYAAAKSALLQEAEVLHSLGYEVLLIDFRGSGGSSETYTSIGYHEAEDVIATIEYARQEWQPEQLYLFGQSMGGVAILRAFEQNELLVDGIIIEAVFDRMVSTAVNRFEAMGLPSFPGAHTLIFWGGVINGHNGFAHNPVTYAEHVTVPTLMLHGSDDDRAKLAEGQSVFTAIPTADKTFEIFSDVAHESYVGAKPEQWQQIVEAFLVQQNSR